MKTLWNYIDSLSISGEDKYRRALLILTPLAALAGVMLWAVAAALGLRGWQWPMIFAGYPMLASPVAVFLYGCRHPFRDTLSHAKNL